MAHVVRNRIIVLSLTALLIAQVVPFIGATGAAGPDPIASNPRTGASFFSIQDALDAAAVGDTITVVNSSVSPATPYAEALTLATDGVTLCATVALGTCAPISAPARWEASASTWADPPVPWQGQALNAGAAGSTSYYATSQQPGSAPLLVSDLQHLSYDLLLASGSCTSGGSRFQFGLDTDADGVKDKTIFAYPPTGFVCVVGQWMHVDAMSKWGLNSLGGPGSATKAQAEALAGSYPIITINLVFDGAPAGTVAWLDNERVNDAVFREAIDAACLDANMPTCTTASAQAATILDAAGAASQTVLVTGDDVTITGFTIKNTDVSSATHRVEALRATGTGVSILGNDIQGNGPRLVASTRDSPEFGLMLKGADFLVANNTISNWAHTGVYVSAGPGTLADNDVNVNRQNALYLEDSGAPVSIVRNDLTQSITNIRIDGRAFELHENTLGVSQYTLDFYTSAAPAIDAQRNHWGAYTKDDIEATIHEDAPGHVVDVSCYYDTDGVSAICPPGAAFTATPSSAHIRSPVQFTDATVPGANAIASRAWTFGDGATSTATNPTHSYQNSGSFDVTLTVTDEEGFVTSATETIGVSNVAPVLATVADQLADEGTALVFFLSATDADGDVLTYSATGLPAGATVASTTGRFAWTPGYTQAGTYTVTLRATDGDMTATQPLTITVANVDRAPSLMPISNRVVQELGSVSVLLFATDADGDAITLSATGLPAWATLTTGGLLSSISGTAGAGDAGVSTITVTATAGSLSASRTFTITVVPVVGLAFTATSPATVHASPGELITLSANVTNTGTTSDTISFVLTSSRNWVRTAPVAVTLAPGETQTVTATFTAPASSERTGISLKAVSGLDPSVSRTLVYSIDVPVVLSVAFEDTLTTLSGAHGVVTVTWLDGSPAANQPVRVRQNSDRLSVGGSFVSGNTGADGTFAFDFGTNAESRIPGTHSVSVEFMGPLPATITSSYEIVVA